MSSPRVTTTGTTGTKAIFKLRGRLYQTGAVLKADLTNLTVAQAETLVASGQATALQDSYLSQFPWSTPPK